MIQSMNSQGANDPRWEEHRRKWFRNMNCPGTTDLEYEQFGATDLEYEQSGDKMNGP